jgi:cyanuric acid amidohydrolase
VEPSGERSAEPRLVVGCAESRRIGAENVGRMGQVHAVAEAVTRALADAGVGDVQNVHAVLVKGPALAPADVGVLRRRGLAPVSEHLWGQKDNVMSYSNDASALGVAAALGEIALDDLSDDVVRRDWSLYSNVAITSSEVGRLGATVVVLGNHIESASELQVGHSSIRDALDLAGVVGALRSAGLDIDIWPTGEQQGAIVQMFGKFVIPGTRTLRGDRAMLLEESDASHTAKVIGGVLVGAVAGHARVFVSGGEWNSHQGSPGCSPVAAVVRRMPNGL